MSACIVWEVLQNRGYEATVCASVLLKQTEESKHSQRGHHNSPSGRISPNPRPCPTPTTMADARVHTQTSNRANQKKKKDRPSEQDAGRRVVFRSVLDNPLVVKW